MRLQRWHRDGKANLDVGAQRGEQMPHLVEQLQAAHPQRNGQRQHERLDVTVLQLLDQFAVVGKNCCGAKGSGAAVEWWEMLLAGRRLCQCSLCGVRQGAEGSGGVAY
jgi:hypothetical protein